MRHERNRASARTFFVRFPDMTREYWVTDRMPEVGARLRLNGSEWTVADIGDYPGLGTVVTLSDGRRTSADHAPDLSRVVGGET